ncbi:periplasmic protein [Campylobacter jejuni subsp. doylei]|nr:periplasmic protein [Campylobacter jejuni subsp. doylei]
MNLKIFSIIVGILIAVIVILGGTYYYLFEYSKPKNYTLNTNTYTEQKSYTNNYDNSYLPSIQTNNSSSDVNINNNTIQKQEANPLDENRSLNNDTNISNNINTNENKQILDTDKEKLKQENKQAKIEALKKEISKQQKILEREKAVKKELQSNKNKYLNTAREYLNIVKNSRLEPELSTENMKVYVLDGKFLSQYRINLLKDMLSVIQDNAKDYYLSIFVKMLPKGEMKLTIYNKEIIFSDMKKAYKYISLDRLSPYLNNPKELNEHVAREEILERLKLQIKKDGKGSDFSKHIKSLKTGLNTAQYFFPFCEIIEISSIK